MSPVSSMAQTPCKTIIVCAFKSVSYNLFLHSICVYCTVSLRLSSHSLHIFALQVYFFWQVDCPFQIGVHYSAWSLKSCLPYACPFYILSPFLNQGFSLRMCHLQILLLPGPPYCSPLITFSVSHDDRCVFLEADIWTIHLYINRRPSASAALLSWWPLALRKFTHTKHVGVLLLWRCVTDSARLFFLYTARSFQMVVIKQVSDASGCQTLVMCCLFLMRLRCVF